MDLLIMSLQDAVDHIPDKPTYVIRIGSSNYNYNSQFPLQDSSSYVHIVEYVFDDNEPPLFELGPKTIDEFLAKSILEDFSKYKDNVEALLVHCSRGKNRAPAVGMALNETFGLGHNTEELKKKYGQANRHVYHMLKKIAQRYKF